MPAIIALEGMHFYAHHGVYDEERKTGGEYIVDVYITTEVAKAAVSDDLNQTINYETVFLICEAVMRRSSKLLENIADRIIANLKHQFNNIKELKVRIRKKNPPLGGRVDWAMIEVSGNFSKNCARCGKPMLCYDDATCWCHGPTIKQASLDQLKIQYGKQCLCPECLTFFAG